MNHALEIKHLHGTETEHDGANRGETGADVRVRTSERANSNPCPPQEAVNNDATACKNSRMNVSHPEISVQNCTDSPTGTFYTGGIKLSRRCNMTNKRQIAAFDVMETLKEETVPGQAPSRPSRESAIGPSVAKGWLERKLQELRQEAGV